MKFNFEISHASAEEERRIRRGERTPKKSWRKKREEGGKGESFRLIFHHPMPTDRPFLHTSPPSSFLEITNSFGNSVLVNPDSTIVHLWIVAEEDPFPFSFFIRLYFHLLFNMQ